MEQHHHKALRILADPFAPEQKWMSALNVFESGKLDSIIDKHDLPVTMQSKSRMFLRRMAARIIDGFVLSLWFMGMIAIVNLFVWQFPIPMDQLIMQGLFFGIIEALFLGFSMMVLPGAIALAFSSPASPACWAPFLICVGTWYYNAWNESKFGHTIGQKILGLHICNYNRQNISFGQATLRHFTRTFSTVLFGFGYLRALTSSAGQTLHDQLSRSVMLPDSRPLASVLLTSAEHHQSGS